MCGDSVYCYAFLSKHISSMSSLFGSVLSYLVIWNREIVPSRCVSDRKKLDGILILAHAVVQIKRFSFRFWTRSCYVPLTELMLSNAYLEFPGPTSSSIFDSLALPVLTKASILALWCGRHSAMWEICKRRRTWTKAIMARYCDDVWIFWKSYR